MKPRTSGYPKRSFWLLARSSKPINLRHARKWELGDDFGYLELLSGESFKHHWPGTLRLYVKKGEGPVADYLGNALGLCIMSLRMLDAVRPLIGESCEFLKAPLFEENTGAGIENFFVVNTLQVLDCVDFSASVVSRDPDGKIRNLNEPCLSTSKIPGSGHMFRIIGVDGVVDSRLFVSNEFGECLVGKGFTGICLERVQAV